MKTIQVQHPQKNKKDSRWIRTRQLKQKPINNSNKPQMKRKRTVQRRNKHQLCDIFLLKKNNNKQQQQSQIEL